MFGKRSARPSIAALHRADQQPPRDPPYVRAKRRNRIADWRAARQIGHAIAEGHDLSDGEQFHYEGSLDELANTAIAETRDGHERATAVNQNVAEDARRQRADAETRIARLDAQDADDAATEQRRSHLTGIGALAYTAILSLCYLGTLPQDAAAASGLPLTATMQMLVALTIGGVLMLAAHFVGDKWHELDEARRTRAENPAAYERIKRELIADMAIPIAVIVAVAVWRGETFSAESDLVGELFTNPLAANVAFAALAVCACLVATYASRAYCRLKPLRMVRRRRRRRERKRERRQVIAEVAERVEAQAELNVEHIRAHLGKTEETIVATRASRKRYVRHRAGVTERTHRRRLVHKGLLAPPHDRTRR